MSRLTAETSDSEATGQRIAFLAPGQGINSWKDGFLLLDENPDKTRLIYETVHDATGVDIIDVCLSEDPVTDPSVVQPAALGIGVARAEALNESGIVPDYLLGLSSGEFTVAAISGALSLTDAAMLAQQRGIYQTEAAGGTGGALVAIHSRRRLKLDEVLDGLVGAHVSGFNTPLKTAIAYTHDVYGELKSRLSNHPGVRRVVDIPNLKFPPHGPAVERAQERLAELLKNIKVSDAAVEIIATRTAKTTRRARTIKHNLIWQTTAPTQLRRGIELALRYGVSDFYDLGPDNIMARSLGDFALGSSIKIKSVDENDT